MGAFGPAGFLGKCGRRRDDLQRSARREGPNGPAIQVAFPPFMRSTSWFWRAFLVIRFAMV